MKRALLVGRWQPCHKAHESLIRQKLDAGIPVLVCVRKMEPDERNPYTQAQVCQMIAAAFTDETLDGRIKIWALPCDVEGVYWGRGVGYNVEELTVEEGVKGISGTEVRRLLNAGEDVSEFVNPRVIALLKSYA